jgi:hypothetical protein
MQSHRRQLVAHVVPMFVFPGLLAFSQVSSGSVVLRHGEFWIYPAQIILDAPVIEEIFWRAFSAALCDRRTVRASSIRQM